MATQAAQHQKGKKFLFGLAVAGLVLLGLYLFVGEQLLFYLRSNIELERPASREVSEVLRIGYAFEPSSLEPTHFDPVTRSRLVDVYEGLVAANRDLKLEPGLAVSWGLLDPLTWEFRMRPGVTFHNGQPLTAEDVVYSLQRAIQYEDSQLTDLLSTISSVEVAGEDRIHVKTRVPDPLLLNKLSITYVYPEGFTDFERPVGTGPYTFVERSDGTMRLSRNETYWAAPPAFYQVELVSIPNRRDRLAALEAGELDLLANLPPSTGCNFTENFADAEDCDKIEQEGDFIVKSIPRLEVSFLMFRMEHELFRLKTVRDAVSKLFDPQVFVEIAFGFAKPADQFVSSGVFGFNPDIEQTEYDLEAAKEAMDRVVGTSFERVVIPFDYPEALQPIGEYVKLQFAEIGIDIELNPLSDIELQRKILNGDSDFYFLGWRSELGDAGDFLQGVIHSDGLFNGTGYANSEVDMLIEASQENLDEVERLDQLQNAMKIVVEDDIIGVPLFESEIIFAVREDIRFEPRVDGYVFASEIT